MKKYIFSIALIASSYASAQTDSLTVTTTKDTLSIVAVGDVMIGSGFPDGYLPKDDAVESFKYVKPYLKGDIVFGNLEGAILDTGTSDKCKNSAEGTCYAFRMPDRYGKIIKEAGFNLMSTANNHANDFGEKGRRNTAKVLDNVGIYHAGPVENKSVVFEKDGVKYGFCAFSPNSNMLSVNNIAQATDLVKELRAQADIVLGHGPHVTRAVEVYKGKFITYSMGNFNTYGQFNLQGVNGIAPLYQIKIDKNGNFIYADVISTKQTKGIGLELDAEGRVFQEIKRLTRLDFPEAQLQFEEGKIRQLVN